MENKTLSQTVSEFSKKLLKYNNSDSNKIVKPLTPEKKLQQQINNSEEERRERILKQYESFKNPVSHQIEEDEQYLINAYNLFCEASELNEKYSKNKIKIADLKISSSLCERSEYVSGFSFLRIWFLKTQENVKYVPTIIQENEKRFLEFIPIEEYEYSRIEKEILQIIEE